METEGGSQGDGPDFLPVRVMDYRKDLLPVEKAVGLTGIMTYKQAFQAVSLGRISLQGQLLQPGHMVSATDALELDGEPLPPRQKLVYYLLNKPRGVMSTCKVGDTATEGEKRKAQEGGVVTDFVPNEPRVVNVGRLDYDSEGLLILSNDGSFCQLITSPQFRILKTYIVQVESFTHKFEPQVPDESQLQQIKTGVKLQSNATLKCETARIIAVDCNSRAWVEVTLTEGKFREIRKLMSKIGFCVRRLVRVGIGPLSGPVAQELDPFTTNEGDQDTTPSIPGQIQVEAPEGMLPVPRGKVLQPGEFCLLTAEEVDAMFALASEA